MAEIEKPNALKHGAFSNMLFLPGEDPAEFEKLRADLIFELHISGASEEAVVDAIAKTIWQERRKDLYQRLQIEGVVKKAREPKLHPLWKSCQAMERAAGVENPQPVLVPPDDADDPMLGLREFATLESLSKELDLDLKIQAKLDRQYKRLWQIKAAKQIDVLNGSPSRSAVESRPLQQLAPPETPMQNGE